MATHTAVKAIPEQSTPLKSVGDFKALRSAHDLVLTSAGGGARMVRQHYYGYYGARRSRSLAAGGVAVFAVALAAWAGALLGAVPPGAAAHFMSNRVAAQAQSATPALHGPPPVPGRPDSASTLQRHDMVRMFMSLDGVN